MLIINIVCRYVYSNSESFFSINSLLNLSIPFFIYISDIWGMIILWYRLLELQLDISIIHIHLSSYLIYLFKNVFLQRSYTLDKKWSSVATIRWKKELSSCNKYSILNRGDALPPNRRNSVPDKGRAIKGFGVRNNWDLELLELTAKQSGPRLLSTVPLGINRIKV